MKYMKKARFGWIWGLIAICVIGLGIFVFAHSARSRSHGMSAESTNASSSQWVAYSSTADDFTATFPKQPAYTTVSQSAANGNIQVDTFKASDASNTVEYAINVTSFPPTTDLSDASGTLQQTVEAFAGNMNGSIATSSLTTEFGYPAIQYVLQSSSGASMSGLNVLTGQRLYQVIASYDTKDKDAVDFQQFISAFVIK